jgi:hypothetical protein
MVVSSIWPDIRLFSASGAVSSRIPDTKKAGLSGRISDASLFETVTCDLPYKHRS